MKKIICMSVTAIISIFLVACQAKTSPEKTSPAKTSQVEETNVAVSRRAANQTDLSNLNENIKSTWYNAKEDKFVYPLTTESKDWKTYDKEQVEQTDTIPDELLNNISSYDLTWLLLSYPYLDIAAYDTFEIAQSHLHTIKGYNELLKRKDAYESIKQVCEDQKFKDAKNEPYIALNFQYNTLQIMLVELGKLPKSELTCFVE